MPYDLRAQRRSRAESESPARLRRTVRDDRQTEIDGDVRYELAGVRAAVEVLSGCARVSRGDELVGVNLDPNRVAGELGGGSDKVPRRSSIDGYSYAVWCRPVWRILSGSSSSPGTASIASR